MSNGHAYITIDPDQPQPGQVVHLRNKDNSGVKMWRWRLQVPKGSKTGILRDLAATCSFTPDLPGFYELELHVNEGHAHQGQRHRTTLYVSGAGELPARLRNGSADIHSIGPARAADLLVDAANQIEADADRIKALMAEVRSLRTFDRGDLL